MAKNADSVSDKATHVAKDFESQGAGALKEMHNDLHGMSVEQRKEFFHSLQSASQGHKLPGLEIHEDAQHHLKVTEKVHGKNHVLFDETARPGPKDGDGQTTEKGHPLKAADGKTQDGKPDDGFSPGLRKGEGPYQALHRQHPEYTHKQLMDESHKIMKESGRNSFSQGEQFKSNDDGSVTTRTPGHGKDGAFTETTQKDGKTSEIKTATADGSWNSQKFDDAGKPGDSVEHKVGADGTYTEITKGPDQKVISQVTGDKDGKNVETFDGDGNRTASIRESNDGTSVVGWKKNADGTQTNIDQPDANHRTEIQTKDGQVISTSKMTSDKDGTNTENFDKDNNQVSAMRNNNDGTSTGWRKNPDGTTTSIDGTDPNQRVETTPRDGGTNTEVYGKDGNQISSMREKGASQIGWHKNADGSTTSIDQPDANHHSETVTKDGKTLSTKSHEQTLKGSTDVITDEAGNKNTNNFDAQGTQIAGVRENNDGSSTGWHKTPNGGTETFDKNAQGHYSSMTFDKKGNVTRTEERDPSGEYKVQEQTAPGIIKTYSAAKGKFGSIVTHAPTIEQGTLSNPSA
ncbi:MAG: hypothetical protein P4L53_20480 [Candidatus Obscuribacterales bacterium]|nr:hypothetical protein [Candidatus Obscuribacterales bacterium]